uniref:calcium homeostasis modulator protein 3-like n=1 Tax=Pristiophorus japonicus TaxID=55135 RepID=UPI00398F3127
MDRFVTVFRYFQSNSESMMNGICGILALASIRIYSTFSFTCPCLPVYNTVYGMGVMLVPPIILFLCGVLVNKHSVLMLEEWRRPEGGRTKDPAVLRYMFLAVVQRAALAPLVWLVVTLLDGKCVVCAFSTFADPARFANLSGHPTATLLTALARVPCKDLTPDRLPHNLTFPSKAVYRYLRSISQALGWSILLLLILAAFLARCLKPCSKHVTFLQTRYWSNYIDIEQRIFDETCCEHARGFARQCVIQFFSSMQSEFTVYQSGVSGEAAGRLHGITDKQQLNKLLKRWYDTKPSLKIRPVSPKRASGCPSFAWHDPHTQSQHGLPSASAKQTALGWSILLLLILAAFLARCLKPCSKHVTFLQTRYWSNYIDIEQRIFDETCCEHARGFARQCVIQFFSSMQSEFTVYQSGVSGEAAGRLHGITDKQQLNKLLKRWYDTKPSLKIRPVSPKRASGYPSFAWHDPHTQSQHGLPSASAKQTVV